MASELRHLSWGGRVALVWYPLRRLFVPPAAPAERCIVGSNVHPLVHCPRRSGEELCCRRHRRSER